MSSWLPSENLQEQSIDECPQCGNKEGLYREIDKNVDTRKLLNICANCNCINQIDL
ncbi:hypothetical protein G9F72_019485 [Clostridium estertheticum]|uniref:hypothetical protein n=1 Tax=Clostridium estertheticum TaxID=238834 RepID=UPI001CD13D3A|nr:hypothetical protein [Clostridium estertheticum]MBZ9688515.1 hypothetical protein [Clostridium estertheticum]